MKTVLNNLNNLDTMDEKDVKNALIAAGFKDEIPGTWDDIKAWIRENKTEIINQGDEVLNDPNKGMVTEFKLNNAEFKTMLTTITNGVADEMTLKINEETGEVIGIKFADVGSGSSDYNPEIFYNEEGINRNPGTDEFAFNDEAVSGSLKMESYAKDLELRYSDFGVLIATKRYLRI